MKKLRCYKINTEKMNEDGNYVLSDYHVEADSILESVEILKKIKNVKEEEIYSANRTEIEFLTKKEN